MSSSERPTWQRDPFFKFLAGLKLAMLLLAVLIGACIFGTIFESGFTAKVARAYVYEAPWFNVWLLLLAVNLACAAFSRWPWKKHHTGFLVTHLGIITLLVGSVLGRLTGIEGTITLNEGEEPTSTLVIDERIIEVTEPDGRRQAVNAEVFKRIPSPERPRYLTRTADGTKLELTGYAKQLEVAFTPKAAAPNDGLPAIRFVMETGMMAQKIDNWLMADNPTQSTVNLGLATVTLRSGTADLSIQPPPEPAAGADGLQSVVENIFCFQNMPDQIGNVQSGVTTGAKIRLGQVTATSKGLLDVQISGSTYQFKVDEVLGKPSPIPNSNLKLEAKEYWPDFRIQDGKPGTLSENPNNPAVLVSISGQFKPEENAAPTPPPMGPNGIPMMDGSGPANSLTLFVAPDGKLTYELVSRKKGRSSGTITNEPLITGWADWKLSVPEILPSAQVSFTATPTETTRMGNMRYQEGIRIRATKGTESKMEWIPLGWQVGVNVAETTLRLIYGYRQEGLPISLQLQKFDVTKYPGTDRPSSFKSTLQITSVDGESATGACWMNNPLSFPSSWIHTWSGLTYKISQASWNPRNPTESTVQILRDPGWGLKWTGSLLIVLGIFFLFYVPQFRRRSAGNKTATPALKPESVAP